MTRHFVGNCYFFATVFVFIDIRFSTFQWTVVKNVHCWQINHDMPWFYVQYFNRKFLILTKSIENSKNHNAKHDSMYKNHWWNIFGMPYNTPLKMKCKWKPTATFGIIWFRSLQIAQYNMTGKTFILSLLHIPW